MRYIVLTSILLAVVWFCYEWYAYRRYKRADDR